MVLSIRVITYLSQVSVSTGHFSVRVHNGDLDVGQYLATLHEGGAVGGPPLQHHHSVHPQRSLVHIHIAGLRVLGTLEREGSKEIGR